MTQRAPASTTGTIPKTADSKTFSNEEGQRQNFVIPPTQYKVMSPEERLTALAKIWADCGLPPKAPGPPCCACPPITPTSPVTRLP